MKAGYLLLALCAASAGSCTSSELTQHPEQTPHSSQLKVLLQGSSTAAMAELIEKNAGVVTHRLPIIKAVGAFISREGLDNAVKSPLVTRYLDDLSVTEDPHKPPADPNEPDCKVGGALELQLQPNELKWTLFNKREHKARLSKLEISWPKTLGKVSQLKFGDETLADENDLDKQVNNKLSLEFGNKDFYVGSTTSLSATFDQANAKTTPESHAQREFDIEASFDGGCSTALIPGYSNNHHDTYYPTVVGADDFHRNGITGKGVSVAIIDSGLWEHPQLIYNTDGQDRVIARYDAITDTEGDEVIDETGHGTHMASVLAMSDPVTNKGVNQGSYKGIAPDVNIVAVKAFNVQGQGDFLDIVRAVQYVVDNREKYNIKVLNLSFAARPRWEYYLDPVNQAVMRAWASGITVVAAAGNEGPDDMTIGSPGNLPYVITVGAVTDSWTVENRNDDYIPDFSSRGPTPDAHIKPDVVAPGGHMTGLIRPGSTLTKEHPDYFLSTGEFVMTGSSQASALVSGVAALLLQLEPDLSPNDIKCKLMSSAEPAINADGLLTYSPFQQGSGYVHASRAVTLGQRGCGNNDLDIQRDMNMVEHFQGPAIITEDGSPSLPGLEKMLSPDIAEKATGENRRWGAKAHVEREGYKLGKNTDAALDWESVYIAEKVRIEQLAKQKNSAEKDE